MQREDGSRLSLLCIWFLRQSADKLFVSIVSLVWISIWEELRRHLADQRLEFRVFWSRSSRDAAPNRSLESVPGAECCGDLDSVLAPLAGLGISSAEFLGADRLSRIEDHYHAVGRNVALRCFRDEGNRRAEMRLVHGAGYRRSDFVFGRIEGIATFFC